MRIFSCVVAITLAVATGAAAAPLFARHPTVADIEASIAHRGARKTVSSLFDENRWDYVSDRIGSGDAGWVALAGKLAPGADAGTAEDLPIALGAALPKNAEAVLAVVQSGAESVGDVCDVPFIEGNVPPGYKHRAMVAVERVADPKLAKTKAACLATLKKS